jgi:hypothetical protein
LIAKSAEKNRLTKYEKGGGERMNRKKFYKDKDKWLKTSNSQKRRYYSRTQCGRSPWTFRQDMMVLEHSMTDTELSAVIGHSVKAIQERRHRLKKDSAVVVNV